MNLNSWNLGTRLGVGFAVLLALQLMVAGVGVQSLHTTTLGFEDAAGTAGVEHAAGRWKMLTQLNVTRAIAIAQSGGHADVKAYFEPRIKATSEQISQLQKDLEKKESSDAGQALFAEIASQRDAYLKARKQVLAELASDRDAAKRRLNASMLPSAEAYLASLDKLEAHEAITATRHSAIARDSAGQGQGWIVLLSAGLLGLGAAIAWSLTRSVTRPLAEALDATRTVAGGQLHCPIQASGRDEAARVLDGLEKMRRALRHVVSNVRCTTDSIQTASAEVAAGSMDLSVRTEQAAASLQQTASTMEQLSGTVRHTADAARTASQLAAAASSSATAGKDSVADTVEMMQAISGRAKEMTDIIGVINGIAFQTNILALNASVEASRAGEHGRGFAVVASEVRSLAQRSSEAARQIKTLIQASADQIEQGTRSAEVAGQTMDAMNAAIQRVNDVIGEISAATAEQSTAISGVNTAVSQLDRMTQQNAALVQQTAAAAKSLEDQTKGLVETVSVFHL